MHLQQNRTRCLNATYFSHNHSSTNESANLSQRQAIAGKRTVKLLLVFNDAHSPIINPTVQIADPRKNTLFLGNCTADRRTISHHDGDKCHIILVIHSSWNYGRNLVLSDLPNIPRSISLNYVPTPLLVTFNTCI